MSESVPGKTALHLLGGGVTGAYFHFGALAAIDDHLSRRSTEFDIFSGVSAGSLVASLTAVGLKPQTAVEAIMMDEKHLFNIERRDIYRFSVMDWSGEALKFLWTFFYICYLKINHSSEAPSFFWGLKDALPPGLFSMRYYERWIQDTLERNSFPQFFSEVNPELYIPAYDLDSCRRVVFGNQGYRHIPLHKAIAASSAIPLFFKPVEIEDRQFVDGELGDMAHLDIPADAGAALVIVINPMTPVRNDQDRVKIKTVYENSGRIRDKGMTYVFDQAMRNQIRLRLQGAINLFGHRYPERDVLLIEPDEDDATMFLYNPMDFEARRQIVKYAYDLTRRKIRENSELWKRSLERHQISVAAA